MVYDVIIMGGGPAGVAGGDTARKNYDLDFGFVG